MPRFGEQLTPQVFACKDAPQVRFLHRLGSEGEQRWRSHANADLIDEDVAVPHSGIT
jgi:hypothetical protein